jgi:hypothetical protein
MPLTSHPYTGEADLPGIVALLSACEEIDHLHESSSVEQLRSSFASPNAEPARNVRLWKDEQGHLIGYTRLWFFEPAETLDARLIDLKIHPAARGGDLETQMLRWAGFNRQRSQWISGRERLSASREIIALSVGRAIG